MFSPVLIVALAAGCTSASPTINTAPDADITFDGLHEVNGSRADKAWARPGLDLAQYNKIKIQRAGIEYRPGGEKGRTWSERARGGPYEVTEPQKQRLLAVVSEAFLDELRKSERYTLVDEAGPDVLLVRGALLDVVSYVPPESVGGRTVVYLSEVGAATLVLEIRDSITEAILVRAIDREAAGDIGGFMTESNRVTNTSEVRRLARRWASSLRNALDNYGKPTD